MTKPFLEHIRINEASSIKAKAYVQPRLNVPLHYHPEHEIVLVVNGSGTALVSDTAVPFAEGEIFLIGGGVPHLFLDESTGSGKARIVVVQFRRDLFCSLSRLPEFEPAAGLLSHIGQGIKISGMPNITALFMQLTHASGIEKFNRLSYLLDYLVRQGKPQVISMTGAASANKSRGGKRLYSLQQFLQSNYQRHLGIEEAAAFTHLGKASFCRFLKKETGKTFTELLNETRITAACKLLRADNLTATQVCYETGFNNPGYFFRLFKRYRGVSPSAYRQQWKNSNSAA
ncbi:MAG TPA: AraC family transcriptional regulator [Flavisolibacter sp.]|nr:AraC family transcriptional regulator [Flavisolibacter sp.]